MNILKFLYDEILKFKTKRQKNLTNLNFIKTNKQQLMKSVRHKKGSNSSFLSNNDLLDNLRKNVNSSFKLLTRQSSFCEFKQIPKKISLIQKKNYDSKSKDNKQNQSLFSNGKVLVSPKHVTHRQKTHSEQNSDQQIQRVIKELNFIYDQINSQEIQLKMILNKNIRRIKDIFYNKNDMPNNKLLIDNKQKQYKQKIDTLTHKIQQQAKKISNSKKESQELKEKLSLYQTKIQVLQFKLQQQTKINHSNIFSLKNQKSLSTVRSQMNVMNSEKVALSKRETQSKTNRDQSNQIQILQNIIQTQQQLINKQMTDFQAQNEEFLRMLQIQAFKIEQLIDKKQHGKQSPYQKMLSIQKKSSRRRDLNSYSNSSRHISSFNQFTGHNTPQKAEDFLLKINKNKRTQGDLSICLY